MSLQTIATHKVPCGIKFLKMRIQLNYVLQFLFLGLFPFTFLNVSIILFTYATLVNFGKTKKNYMAVKQHFVKVERNEAVSAIQIEHYF